LSATIVFAWVCVVIENIKIKSSNQIQMTKCQIFTALDRTWILGFGIYLIFDFGHLELDIL
jgi:hypothetical protein